MKEEAWKSPDGRPTSSGSHASPADAEELRVIGEARKEAGVERRDPVVCASVSCFCPSCRAPKDGTRLAAPGRVDRRKVRFTHMYIYIYIYIYIYENALEPNFVNCANLLAGNWSSCVSRFNAYMRFLGVCLFFACLALPFCVAFTWLRVCAAWLLWLWFLGANRIYGLWGGDETATDHFTNLKFVFEPNHLLASPIVRALPSVIFFPHLSGRWEGRVSTECLSTIFIRGTLAQDEDDYPIIL